MSSLKGKVAIVTGASRGIGRGIAEALAQEGATIVVNFRSSPDQAQEVVKGIESKGGRALAIQADASQVSDIRRLFQEGLKHFGSIDIVIANAAIFSPKSIEDSTEEEFDAMFTLNAKGVFFTLQEAGRHISNNGRIIYISSCATASSYPGSAMYKGSKAAGEQFVTTLAHELGPRHVTVNTVSPGFTDTEMLPKEQGVRETGIQMSPLKRLGQPSDIANVVVFLVSQEGGWITGDTIQACGGIV